MKTILLFAGIAAALLLSSCQIRMHRVAYEYPRHYEGLWVPNNSEIREGERVLTKRLFLYECDGQWYLPVTRVRYRKYAVHGNTPWHYHISSVSHDDKSLYYLPIPENIAQLLRSASKDAVRQGDLIPHIPRAELKTSLPARAKAYPILLPLFDSDTSYYDYGCWHWPSDPAYLIIRAALSLRREWTSHPRLCGPIRLLSSFMSSTCRPPSSTGARDGCVTGFISFSAPEN